MYNRIIILYEIYVAWDLMPSNKDDYLLILTWRF